MSSVANNHTAANFSQPPSLISVPKSSSANASSVAAAVTMPFYKRNSGGTQPPPSANQDCYNMEGSSIVPTSRQGEYAVWNSTSSQWPDATCDSRVGSLPAAQSLLSHSSKGVVVTTTASATVITNQNGKSFTASTNLPPTPLPSYSGYESHQQYTQNFSIKRGATYSGTRPSYLNNSSGGAGLTQMEYNEAPPDLFHPKPGSTFQHLSTDMHFQSYRYANNGNNGGTRDERVQIPLSGLQQQQQPQHAMRQMKMHPNSYQPGETTGISPPQSLASSDGETATSSRGASSLPSTGAVSMATSGVIGASGSLSSTTKKPRKPAKTLATGRRNLKLEEVDPDEADRRNKRRERNRKSAQKCRERKMHKTQELQNQVTELRARAAQMQHELAASRHTCQQLLAFIKEHAPGVKLPNLACLAPDFIPQLPPPTASSIYSMEMDSMPYCDMIEHVDAPFYGKPQEMDAYDGNGTANNAAAMQPTIPNTNNNTSLAMAEGDAWSVRGFGQPTAQLPPVSQFVPLTDHLKPEPSVEGIWNGDNDGLEPFLAETSHDGAHEAEWKAANDTDSSPGCMVTGRLNTPTNSNNNGNTEGDKNSTLSGSL